jgi:hypothetical protein
MSLKDAIIELSDEMINDNPGNSLILMYARQLRRLCKVVGDDPPVPKQQQFQDDVMGQMLREVDKFRGEFQKAKSHVDTEERVAGRLIQFQNTELMVPINPALKLGEVTPDGKYILKKEITEEGIERVFLDFTDEEKAKQQTSAIVLGSITAGFSP